MTAQTKKIPESKNSSSRIAVLFIAVITIGLLIGIFSPGFGTVFNKLVVSPTPTPTVTLTPTPFPTVIPVNLRPLPPGKQIYQVSSSDKSGPSYSKLVINPLAVLKGYYQTVSVMVDYNSPVKSVTLTTVTDTKSTPQEMKLVEGTVSSGRWEGTWIMDDYYYFKYAMKIEAVAESGAKSSLNPVFR